MLYELKADGFFEQMIRRDSPNFDERPSPYEINLIVVHGISLPPGRFGLGFVQQMFCKTLQKGIHPFLDLAHDFNVSSHFFIPRNGHTEQFVSCYKRAWHAGRSEFDGVKNCNDYSIGIELEGTDTTLYTQTQYESLVTLCHSLMRVFDKITPDRVVGHVDVAPGRKTDPGDMFDWSHFSQLLNNGV